MKKMAQFVSKMPFSGKTSIRSLAFGLYYSQSKIERLKAYAWLMLLLIILIAGHAFQIHLGIKAMFFNSPFWAKSISFLVALVNFLVVLTQIYLSFRFTVFLFKGKYLRKAYEFVERSDIITPIIVTLAGQAIFFTQFVYFAK